MIDKNLFLETLHEVAEIAATSGEKIKPEEVHKYFEGMELSPEQEKMVEEGLEEEARKAWQHARKYRNKKVKPEKVKVLEKLSAEKSTGSLR